ncbi:CPBP family intramembrane metalloprotease [Sphingobacterium sp. InxBP1]|uniref:CPBP family glutamic-type intramembrane protease n=1 Tax=Sphingobacterium sp. InxBP1 TaxID=2870328 RepID=UPI002243BBD1|nr:CPBP family glutamic-type intramembrane protease [Sphingobacterium sp. InxBP1]MCW8310728.1 CPBP family intramembrane metalloprotease [Sphingobacterium sp. InxBP1]
MLTKDKIKSIGYLYLLFICIGFILMMIIRSIDTFLVVDYYKLPSLLHHDVLKSVRALTNNNSFLIVLLAAFFVPIVEETMFRLWLSLDARHIAISFSAILTYFLLGIKDLFKVNLMTLAIILSFIMIGLVIYRFLKGKDIEGYLTRFISIKFLGSISAIAFGLIHITNFAPINTNIWFIYPIYVLPQIVLGYLTVYLRLKHGFIYAVGLHVLVNFIAVLMKI